jgi:hypothetical protein
VQFVILYLIYLFRDIVKSVPLFLGKPRGMIKREETRAAGNKLLDILA